jgi:Na+/melibiose symporter-like transporter
LKERAFVALALAYGLHMLAQSASSAMMAYVGKYISPLGANFLPVFMGLSMLVSIIAMVLWTLVARRLSKRHCFMIGSVIGAAGYLATALGVNGPIWLLIVGGILVGIGFSAGQVFGFSMLPDVIDQVRRRTGENREGVFTGVWVGWEKIGLAFGAMLAGQFLGLTGFLASVGETVTQPPAALSMIVTMFAYAPALLMLAALVPLMSRSLRAP